MMMSALPASAAPAPAGNRADDDGSPTAAGRPPEAVEVRATGGSGSRWLRRSAQCSPGPPLPGLALGRCLAGGRGERFCASSSFRGGERRQTDACQRRGGHGAAGAAGGVGVAVGWGDAGAVPTRDLPPEKASSAESNGTGHLHNQMDSRLLEPSRRIQRSKDSCFCSATDGFPQTLPFDVFVRRAAEVKHKEYFLSEDEKYYLRSVGEDARKDIADIRKQFPILAEDVQIPEYFEKEQFFSSVFRISSAGLQLWTHYDVMDNFLIQVTGKKRVVLYSPRDAPYLYLSGTKSQVLDVDNPDLEKYPLFVKAKRYQCFLEAGDVLFIPALWFHNVISEEFGVALNVFWKHLPAESYDKSDTYGNKDPMAASRAIQILDRALKTLEELPEEYRDFYARRMVLRIQEKAYRNDYG